MGDCPMTWNAPLKSVPVDHGLGGDVAGEEAVDVNGGGALLPQSPCKLPREEDVGQLAVAISSGAVE